MAGKPSIDQDLIRQLAALLHETDLSEIEVEQDELRVRVARTIAGPAMATYVGAPSAAAAPGPAPAAAPAPVEKRAGPDLSAAVPSPMVGTAYLSPEPGAEPYVRVGAQVKKGETVLIIEAMKHMNQIASPRAGRVTAILVEDGKPVEFGEPLLVIE